MKFLCVCLSCEMCVSCEKFVDYFSLLVMLTSNSQCFAEALYYNLANEEADCQADEYQLWGSEEMEQEVEEQEMEEQEIPEQEIPEQEDQEVQGQEEGQQELISSDEEVEVPVRGGGEKPNSGRKQRLSNSRSRRRRRDSSSHSISEGTAVRLVAGLMRRVRR